MLAGKTLRQQDSHIELAALGANLKFVAAIGKTQAMLIEAILRFASKGIQVAQMELKVSQVVGGDLDAHGNGISGRKALGDDAAAANLSANLVGTRLASRKVVAAQATLSPIIGLGLQEWERINVEHLLHIGAQVPTYKPPQKSSLSL